MKVLICSTGYNSKEHNTIGVFQLDQAKALAEYGHDVRVASIDMRSAKHKRKYGTYSYTLEGLQVSTSNYMIGRFPLQFVNSFFARRCATKSFKEVTKDGWKPDVIHAHFIGIGEAYANIAVHKKYPYVITEHFSKMHVGKIEDDILKLAQYAYPKADILLAVSNSLSVNIKKNTGFDSVVVPNIVDTNSFIYNPREKKDNQFVFITAGRLVKGKGMDVLIDAFSRMENKAAYLIIMGDGPERIALEEQVHNLNLTDKILFFGAYSREEFNEQLNNSDSFVLASRGETFGVVYVEAMLTGKPIIATSCGGPEDFISEDIGRIVPVDNVGELSHAMDVMTKEYIHYNPNNIIEYAKSTFAPEVIAAKLTDIYQRIQSENKTD